jgi:flagellar protein FlaJ
MSEHSSAPDDAESPDSAPWRSLRQTDEEDRPTAGVSPATDAAAFRDAYGILRGPLKRRSDQFTSLEGWLAQAQFDRTPAEYLATAIRRSLAVAAVALALHLVLVGVLAPRVAALAVLRDLAVLPVLGTGVAIAGVAFGVTSLAHYYYPRVWATLRRRHIEADLPHAVVFMYVLSEAGLNLQQILERVADSEETYGEVAREFRGVVVDMERFGLDTLTALNEAKHRTPSTDLAEFLDDLENVIESGGHLDSFLENQSETQLQDARQRQENLIETVAAVVEGYITIVFAGPIFLVTILVILAFVGIDTLVFVNLTTYLLIPAGILGFLGFFHLFNRPYERPLTIELDEKNKGTSTDEENKRTSTDDPQIRAYRKASRIKSFKQFLREPVPSMQQRPVLSLAFTVPVAMLVWLGIVLSGVARPADYATDPIGTTTMLVVVPLLIPSFGLMFANESERRRKLAVRRRLPEVLRGLADSTENGVLLPDGISLAARRSEGALAAHLQRLDNDIRVTGDVHHSLREFAAEVGVNRVTRVSRILIEGHRTSSMLASVLDIAAEDARERYRLDIEWRHAMQPYVVFFMLGVVVYLFIILIFLEVFFPILTDIGVEEIPGTVSFGPGDVSIPTTAFEGVLYHSLLIQALGNGLVMGKLVENNVISGLKYANPLLVIVVVIFYAI